MLEPTADSALVVALSRARAAEEAGLRRGIKILFIALSVAVLSAALPALLLADIEDAPRSDAWVVTVLIMVWSGIRLTMLWVKGAPRLFDFFFWLFTYIFMGLAPTAQIRTGLISYTTPDIDPGLDLPTAGVVVLGLLSYEIGRLAWILREHRPSNVEHVPRVTAVHSGRTVVLAALSVAASAYFLSRIGFTALLGSRDAAIVAREAVWPDSAVRGIVTSAAIYPMLTSTGALTQLARVASSRAARMIALVAAIGCATMLLLIVNPVASARYAFGTVAFALVVYLGAMTTWRRARVTMLATMAGFLFIFPIADAFRRTEVRVSRSGFFGEYPMNADYDAFWQIANSLSYWLDGYVVPLRQFLGSVLFWVPRVVWPDKPNDTGIMLADYRSYSFGNLSAPVWSEALVNGGMIAVIIAFLAMGAGLRAMDTRVLPAFATGGTWAIVGAILPVYMTILMRGSLLQATDAVVVIVVCILFVSEWRARGEGAPSSSPVGTASASRRQLGGASWSMKCP